MATHQPTFYKYMYLLNKLLTISFFFEVGGFRNLFRFKLRRLRHFFHSPLDVGFTFKFQQDRDQSKVKVTLALVLARSATRFLLRSWFILIRGWVGVFCCTLFKIWVTNNFQWRWLRSKLWHSQTFVWMCRLVSVCFSVRPIFWHCVGYVDIKSFRYSNQWKYYYYQDL